ARTRGGTAAGLSPRGGTREHAGSGAPTGGRREGAAPRERVKSERAPARRRMLARAEGRRRIDAERDRARPRHRADMRAINEEACDAERRKTLLILAQPVAPRQRLDDEIAHPLLPPADRPSPG